MELCNSPTSLVATSPPPITAVDCTSLEESYFEESPAKLAGFPQFDPFTSKTVRLICKNGEEITVERNQLTYYSMYFRCLFSSNFRDSKAEIHRIGIVSSSDLHFLLTIPRAFENGITPELSFQRAIQLLEPAAYLQMDFPLDFITEVIYQNVKVDNLIRLLRLSLLYHIPLAKRLWECMVSQFQALYQSNEYLKLTEDELVQLLCEKKLNIKTEHEKMVIANWVEHNGSGKVLRFADANLARHPMPDATNYEVIRTRQPASAIVAIGGWCHHGVAPLIEIFNTRTDRWQTCNFDYDVPDLRRAYSGIELIDNSKLVVYGGLTGNGYLQTTVVFDIDTKKWHTGKNMYEKRNYIQSAQLADSQGRTLSYACGGCSGIFRLHSAEAYDVGQDQWTEISPMKNARSDGSLVAIGGKLFAVGGFDGRNIHSTAEMYDPIVDTWTQLSRGMRVRRTGLCAVNIMDQVVMVCGGFNGHRRVDTSEMYDLREGVWHQMPLMHCGRSNFGISRLDTFTVHVGGGFDGTSVTKENERLDLRNRKWQALPDLNEAKSALKFVKLSDRAFLDELFAIPDDEGIVMEW